MSHHFDTQHAKADPRLNLCDVYVFEGNSDSTVFVMTMNADAGISSPDIMHPEGLYAFRIDLNGDAKEELAFKFRFGEPKHLDGDEHIHVQSFKVLRSTQEEIANDAGSVLLEGTTGITARAGDVRAYVSMVPELWAADAFAFFSFLKTFFAEDRVDLGVFQHKTNLFQNRNVMAIVLEVPNAMVGSGMVHVWGTISLYGHAPEVQVSRWGYPLFTHFFLSDPKSQDLAEKYHTTVPSDDLQHFGPAISSFASELAASAKSAANPEQHGQYVAARLCPSMLPYTIGTRAVFDKDTFNGRPLGADAFDAMLSLGVNSPIRDGVGPAANRIVDAFPYYGAPFDKSEQTGLTAIQGDIGLEYGGVPK
jgi:hypothetical protein